MNIRDEQRATGEFSARGLSKIDLYKWKTRGKPGRLCHLDKNMLEVDATYQRDARNDRVLRLARDWSWIACGVILVAQRIGTNRFYVIDGQHRVLAACKREDIQQLPCLVFETQSNMEEAQGFSDVNSNRRMPTTMEKWRPDLACRKEIIVYANSLIESSGRTASGAASPTTVACLTSLLRAIESNREAVARVWPLIIEVCEENRLHERIFEGLFYIETHLPDDESLTERRWRERVLRVKYQGLLDASGRAAAFYARGGARVWGLGMVEAMNKGCRHHLKLREEVE